MNIKYDAELIQQVNLFEKITAVNVKECFYFKDKLTFMVDTGLMGKALGKNKIKLEKLEKMYNKPLRIIEFNSDMQQFITNLIAPLRIVKYEESGGIVVLTGPDTKTKGLMIGSKAKNLRETEKVVQKYFSDLKEIKIV